MTVKGPPDDYTHHLKAAAHEALSMTDNPVPAQAGIVECELLRLRTVCMGAVLRAEIERLQTANEYAFTELTAARAEVERLRGAYQEIRDLENNKVVSGEGLFMRALLIARRALGHKP